MNDHTLLRPVQHWCIASGKQHSVRSQLLGIKTHLKQLPQNTGELIARIFVSDLDKPYPRHVKILLIKCIAKDDQGIFMIFLFICGEVAHQIQRQIVDADAFPSALYKSHAKSPPFLWHILYCQNPSTSAPHSSDAQMLLWE